MNSQLSIFNVLQRGWRAILVLTFSALLTGGLGLLLMGCGHDHGSEGSKDQTLYTCGMHPQVIQNKPGLCPICGMKLTPVRKQPGGGSETNHSAPGAAERKVKFYKSTMTPGEVSPTPRKDSMGM